jgi:hypothetical protein
MPEAIGRSRNALRSFAQLRFAQKIGDQEVVESLCGLAGDIGKYSVFRFRDFEDYADAF